MERETNRFKAVSAAGDEFTIIEWHKEIDVSNMLKHGTVLSKLARLRTTEGYAVNKVDDGVYDIVELNMLRVTSTDPNAV